MSQKRLQAAKAALLDSCERVVLKSIEFIVPPVPTGAMALFCDLIQEIEDFSKNPPTENKETFERAGHILDNLCNIFYITTASLDSEITLEEVKLLIDMTNFVEVQRVLMVASGLIPKQTPSPTQPQEEIAKPRGRTGRK